METVRRSGELGDVPPPSASPDAAQELAVAVVSNVTADAESGLLRRPSVIRAIDAEVDGADHEWMAEPQSQRTGRGRRRPVPA